MPEYRFRCNDCMRLFDVEQERDAPHDSATCPRCGQPAYRAWTVPVVVFRGDGFTLSWQGEEEPGQDDPLCDGLDGLECLGTCVG